VHSVPHNAAAFSTAFDVIPPSLALQAPACTASQLQASYGGSVSPETGEHSAVIDLLNASTSACGLVGYPDLSLFAGSAVLPFRYQHGGNYIFELPRSIVVGPGQFAHFLLAKYCCLSTIGQTVTSVQISLPGASSILAIFPTDTIALTFGPDQIEVGPYAAGRQVG
jgi:hypothetical protein